MNPLNIIMLIMKYLPKIIDAVRTIRASDAGKTVEGAVEDLIHHITPGGPAAPALSPDAPPLVTPTVVDHHQDSVS